MESTLVTNIQGYSIHDGPGIRTVVFLKGCPLRCKWCANPENLKSTLLVGWLSNLCKQCGRCIKACEEGAILPNEDKRIDREKCTNCGKCVSACYYGALVAYGEEKTSKEVFEKVRRDKMFYDTSGGGVTFSGGEPLVHSRFVKEVLEACKEDGINTCVETCGCIPLENVKEVVPFTDIFYFDLKIMDEELHKKYTGRGNADILENARYLAASGAKILFRQPLIPGVNDNEANVKATSEFILSLGRDDIGLQIMPYHRMGTTKYAALDMKYELEELQIMETAHVDEIEALYKSFGINCTVSR